VFATTAVGTFAVFMKANKIEWEGGDGGDRTYKPAMGLIVAACTLVVSYLAVITSCCVSRNSDYENIA
jgi:hypothetical protein